MAGPGLKRYGMVILFKLFYYEHSLGGDYRYLFYDVEKDDIMPCYYMHWDDSHPQGKGLYLLEQPFWESEFSPRVAAIQNGLISPLYQLPGAHDAISDARYNWVKNPDRGFSNTNIECFRMPGGIDVEFTEQHNYDPSLPPTHPYAYYHHKFKDSATGILLEELEGDPVIKPEDIRPANWLTVSWNNRVWMNPDLVEGDNVWDLFGGPQTRISFCAHNDPWWRVPGDVACLYHRDVWGQWHLTSKTDEAWEILYWGPNFQFNLLAGKNYLYAPPPWLGRDDLHWLGAGVPIPCPCLSGCWYNKGHAFFHEKSRHAWIYFTGEYNEYFQKIYDQSNYILDSQSNFYTLKIDEPEGDEKFHYNFDAFEAAGFDEHRIYELMGTSKAEYMAQEKQYFKIINQSGESSVPGTVNQVFRIRFYDRFGLWVDNVFI